MDLRINSNGYAAAAGIGQTAEAPKAAETAKPAGGGFTIAEMPRSGTVDALETMQVPDSALRRDDALGKLMNEAFSFPPPPMPNFTD